MIKKITLLILSSVVSHAVLADTNSQSNQNIQSVVDAFTNCDSSFFYQLKNNRAEFDPIAEIKEQQDIAYFSANDMSEQTQHSTTYYFSKPIEYRGLKLVGYKNIMVDVDFWGNYYYWGFIVDGDINQVKQSLGQFSWQQYSETNYIAHAQIYDSMTPENRSWQANPYSIDGVITRQFTTEKSLFLEPFNGNQTYFMCSMQGDMDQALIESIRPDLKYVQQEAIEQQRQLQQQLETENDAINDNTDSNEEI